MKRIFLIAISSALFILSGMNSADFAYALSPKVEFSDSVGLKYLDENFYLYDDIQKQIHRFAEPGYQEYKSSELLASHLESKGFVIERGIANLPTAFKATFGKGSPVIGIMAEYDALLGMSQDTVPYKKVIQEGASGHGCGHNILGTGAVAAAVAISEWLKEGHKGTVCLYGTPAEEGGGGKAYMMREGCFDGLDVMFDWHPHTQNTINTHSGLANVQVKFTFKGISSHASGAPEDGRSALDAVEAFDYMMNLMREHLPSTSRIHYVITNGGKSPNIVPDYCEVIYYLRSPKRVIVGDMLDRALNAAQGAALGTGTTFSYELISGNYERLPNEQLNSIIYSNLLRVGGVHYDRREMEFALKMMSESNVQDTTILKEIREVIPSPDNGTSGLVSSDVGNVTWGVPTGSFRYASFVPAGGGHCWQQTSSGGTTIGTKGAIGAAKVIYLSAYQLLTNPKLIDGIKREFLEKRGENFEFKPLMGDREAPLDYTKR